MNRQSPPLSKAGLPMPVVRGRKDPVLEAEGGGKDDSTAWNYALTITVTLLVASLPLDIDNDLATVRDLVLLPIHSIYCSCSAITKAPRSR